MSLTRAQLAEQFDRDEQLGADAMALELAIEDAGGWDAYVALRDGQSNDEKRSA